MNRINIAVTILAAVVFAACQPTAASSTATPSPSSPSTADASATPGPSSIPASPTPTPTPKPPVATPTPAAPTPPLSAPVPPPPFAVKMASVGVDLVQEGYDANLKTTVTWKGPLSAGTEIRVYGVTACFAPPSGGPCLVEHTALPDSVRDLIAKAPASKGKLSWTWPNWEDIGGAVMAHGDRTYNAVVIAAYNAFGHSKFIIIASGTWCPDCIY